VFLQQIVGVTETEDDPLIVGKVLGVI